MKILKQKSEIGQQSFELTGSYTAIFIGGCTWLRLKCFYSRNWRNFGF